MAALFLHLTRPLDFLTSFSPSLPLVPCFNLPLFFRKVCVQPLASVFCFIAVSVSLQWPTPPPFGFPSLHHWRSNSRCLTHRNVWDCCCVGRNTESLATQPSDRCDGCHKDMRKQHTVLPKWNLCPDYRCSSLFQMYFPLDVTSIQREYESV